MKIKIPKKEEYFNHLKNIINNKDNKFLVAIIDNEVGGYCYASVSSRKRRQHSRSIAMGLSKKFRGKGIGKKLLTEIIEWAKSNQSIEKLNLGVLSVNKVAINMYRSLGFEDEGILEKEYKMEYGTYVDDIYMRLFV
ncbi:N-acetyltransferase family protein [Macrococcus equi]|uniref:GNAT family N-acetyltransferase n=1 Tax=Macrococcus equi TaxID=3395462 RepID=UPI0039BE9B1B